MPVFALAQLLVVVVVVVLLLQDMAKERVERAFNSHRAVRLAPPLLTTSPQYYRCSTDCLAAYASVFCV